MLYDIISIMEENNIKFLVVSNNRHFERAIYPPAQELLEKLNDKNFLDLNGNRLLSNNDYYCDSLHLNYRGSELYTELIADKLNSYI